MSLADLRGALACGAAAVALWGGGAAAAWAGPTLAPPAQGALSMPQARSWLGRIHTAAHDRNYQGTLVMSAGGQISSSRVVHFLEGGQRFERIDMLDGQMRRVLRHNEQIVVLWPSSRIARKEVRDPLAHFPALLTGGDEQWAEHYDLLSEGTARVAGREAYVFLLRPRDAARFAKRVWADVESGLQLRADVLAPDGRTLETAAFSDVTLGVKPSAESVLVPMKRLDGYKVVATTTQRTSVDAEGWRLSSGMAGFRVVSCVKRNIDSVGEARADAVSDTVQVALSDGLTHVTLFIESQRPERHRAGHAVLGATHTLSKPMGTHWVTVMGDVPPATLKLIADTLERKR